MANGPGECSPGWCDQRRAKLRKKVIYRSRFTRDQRIGKGVGAIVQNNAHWGDFGKGDDTNNTCPINETTMEDDQRNQLMILVSKLEIKPIV